MQHHGVASDDLGGRLFYDTGRERELCTAIGAREWRHMAEVHLSNGDGVGVAEVWTWPDTFDGMTAKDLLAVQNAIDGKQPRFSDQAGSDWVRE